MTTTHNFEPADTIRLVLALNRAMLTPFGSMEWACWAGATGAAHIVTFQDHDKGYLLKALGLEHVPAEYVTVILDEMGVSFNVSSPVNAYAWAVHIELGVTMCDVPTAEVYWRTDASRPYGTALDQKIAGLPPEVRSMVMACPDAARAHVVAGYLQSVAPPPALEPQPTAPEALRSGTVYLCRGETDQARFEEDGTPVGTTEWLFCDAPVDGDAGYSENHLSLLTGLDQFRGCAINTAAANFSPLERSTFNMWAQLYGAQSTWTPPADRATTTDGRPAAWVARANARWEQAGAA